MSAQDRNGWIELEAYCEKYGERKNTVHKRVVDGIWPRGEYLSSPSGGVCYVNEPAAREWLLAKGKLKEEA
jgi:hypothetical protein